MDESPLRRQLERARRNFDYSVVDSPDPMSPLSKGELRQSTHAMHVRHQQTDLSPVNWGDAEPGASLGLSPSPAADRTDAGADSSPPSRSRASPQRRSSSPRRSPRASPGRGGAAAADGPSLSQTMAAHESARMHHEDFDHAAPAQPQSPARKGVLGAKAQERGTPIASAGLGMMPERVLSFEAFHRRFTNTAPGAFVDGDTSSLVEEATREAQAAKQRSATTSGYNVPVSRTLVTTGRPKTSSLHHSTRVTTGASFLDAEMPFRSTFLVLQDERKLTLAAKHDRDSHGHLPAAPPTTTTSKHRVHVNVEWPMLNTLRPHSHR